MDRDELATATDDNGEQTTIVNTDCLLNIIVENAQDNLDILLPTLQFVEVNNSTFREKRKKNVNNFFCLIKGLVGQHKRTYNVQYDVSVP